MSDYSWKEMMAVVFSREIEDTDKITSGAHTEIFFAATMLAQKTHAPNLKLQLGGSVTLVPGHGRRRARAAQDLDRL